MTNKENIWETLKENIQSTPSLSSEEFKDLLEGEIEGHSIIDLLMKQGKYLREKGWEPGMPPVTDFSDIEL